ncbi:uncharacterized protein LOC122500858 [Leptopilina heterotoma]|uniref:uncharacterized protein LOC122500858 n=1 Tax=Leptopilina heterotoma TaxID=63436 RepID=UPI001CA9376B|nr:uncharacterized protein LOC122500858 [Leptopilina heterotoma]
MNLGKQFSVTLLLGVVIGFTAFVYGKNSKKKFDYYLDPSKICDETENAEFISIMKKTTNDIVSFVPGRFIVLTDSKTNMNANLRQKLEEEKAMFLQFHRTFNIDIQETFGTAVILSRVNDGIVFLIHADSIDSAVNIYENITYIVPLSISSNRKIAFALTLSENKDIRGPMIKKLENVANTVQRREIFFSVQTIRENSNSLIAIFTKDSSTSDVNDFLAPFLIKEYTMDSRLHDRSFNFSEHMQQVLNCGVETTQKKVTSGMKNLTNSILNNIEHRHSNQQSYNESILKDLLNCIRKVATLPLMQLNSAKDYFLNLDICNYNHYTEKLKTEINFTGLERQTIDSIYHFVDNSKFNEAMEEWKQVLKHFHLKDNIKNQSSDNVKQICDVNGNECTLRITGIVIKVSDLKLNNCSVNPKVIEVFATKRVIINKDIILIGKEIQMVIIAPIWEVDTIYSDVEISGYRVINLSGENGKDDNKRQANNGTKDGNKNGAHGRAGLPGGPAGSFYGIADKIINAEKLNILVDGGRGGNGQHGGNGVEGANGLTYNEKPGLQCPPKSIAIGWNSSQVERPIHSSAIFNAPAINQNTYKYKILGKGGRKGGSGGNGGIGGIGGQKGFVTIVELSSQNRNQYQFSELDGEVGSNGTGGKSALGGKNGKNVLVTFSCLLDDSNRTPQIVKRTNLSDYTGMAEIGLDGENGTSLKRNVEVERLQTVNIFPRSVNEYKMFLRPHLSESKSTEEWSFYNHLNTHENITKVYDPFSLVNDFIGLEKHFFSLNKKINFTSSYEQLKNRIDTYKNHLSKKSAEYLRIINDLAEDVNNRLEAVKSIHLPYAVNTDFLKEDEDLLSLEVTDLKDFRRTKNILYQLNEKIFLLEENMKSGEQVIKNVILNAISDIEETLDEDLNSLLTEIIETVDEIYANQTVLDSKRLTLQHTMRLKVLFGILTVGCGALGVINPALGFVAGVAVSAITVLDVKTAEERDEFITVLPKAVENFAKQSDDYFKELEKKQEQVLQEQEKFINREIQLATIHEKNIINNVWGLTEDYRKLKNFDKLVSNSGYHMKKIYAKEEEKLKDLLKKLKKSEDKQDSKKIDGVKIGIRVAKYLKATSEAFKAGTETVTSIMKDGKKVDEIEEAMNKNEKAIKKLFLMEENIYDSVKPLLSTMQNNLGNIERKVKNMNQFEQAIAKWNVTRTIEDIKLTLHNATENLKTGEKIERSFGILTKAFDLLFEVHRLLLQSKEKQKDTIDQTILHIAHDSIFGVSDYHLRYALSELEVVKMSNYVAET